MNSLKSNSLCHGPRSTAFRHCLKPLEPLSDVSHAVNSENHRKVSVGRGLKAQPAPSPAMGCLSPPAQAAQGPSNLALSTSRDGAAQLSGQLYQCLTGNEKWGRSSARTDQGWRCGHVLEMDVIDTGYTAAEKVVSMDQAVYRHCCTTVVVQIIKHSTDFQLLLVFP